ncbi:HCN2, partial [Symbiodinium necroappetens]
DNIAMAASSLAWVSQQALCQDSPALPHEWSIVQLAWLPKPNKTPTCPEHLRSIGLLSADSKGFLLILRREITPFIREALTDVPQYAYRPQPGTLDASCAPVYIAPRLVFRFTWQTWLCRLCRRLDAVLGDGWSRRHLSIFADDTHGSWIIRNERELCDSVQHLRVLIDTLESMGLQINYTKSQIVIQLRGQLVAKMQKKFFKQRHGVQCLRIQADQDIYLPCVDRLDYLGTVLSYSGFESQTVQLRAQKADNAFRQLRKPLRSRSALSTGHRVRLYRAIVLSSLVYGLVGVGVTVEVVRKVSSTVAGHMRKILRIYEHGISNAEVLRRACIDPIAILLTGVQRLGRSITLDCFRSQGLKQREMHRVREILEQLSAHAAQPEGTHILYVRKAEVGEIACPECGTYFGTREGLSQHIKKKHPDIAHRSKLVFDRESHTLFGIPMCRFCHLRLHDWSSITKHIQDGHCSWVKEKIAEGHASIELLQLIEARETRHSP